MKSVEIKASIEAIRLNGYLFEKTKEAAKNTFIFRTASKPQAGILWGASLDLDGQIYYSLTMSNERPETIHVSEDCTPVEWHKASHGFRDEGSGTIRRESLVREDFSPSIYKLS